MSYRIQPTHFERFELLLEGESANCHPLPMAPVCREPELNHGLWLVLVFATWSGPDHKAIETALEVGRESGDRLQVGVRPFDKKEELQAWCPKAKLEWISPTWLVFREGELVNEMFGPRPLEKVRETVQAHFGAGS